MQPHLGIHITNTRAAGGQFQFLVSVLEALAKQTLPFSISLICFDDAERLAERFSDSNWNTINLRAELALGDGPVDRTAVGPAVGNLLRTKYKLDAVFFPTWTDGGFGWGLPQIFTVHDLQHRLQPEFSEVSYGAELGGSWAWRETLFSQSLAQATAVLVDSEEGKSNVLEFYNFPPEKIHVLPYTLPNSTLKRPTPAQGETLRSKYGLSAEYFFYPAQFWPHKNHYRIVEALGLLKQNHGTEVDMVFTGGIFEQWKILETCSALAQNFEINDRIKYLGYVSDEEAATLYSGSSGLIMPTYFGPTNIPYLEAFYYGCPVVASDLPGIREQVGEAGILVNPRSSKAIAAAMQQLLTEPILASELIAKGKERFVSFAPERFKTQLISALQRALALS